MKQYDAYLFDWDGTLANTLSVWMTAIQRHYKQFDIHMTALEIGPLLGDWAATCQPVPAQDRAAFRAVVEEEAGKNLHRLPLYPGVVELLQNLKTQHKKLVLITTTKREVIDMVLAHHELIDYFDLIITGDEVQAHKPDPEGILFTLKRLGVAKDRAVMIGDSDKDLNAASNAGIDSILFYPKEHEAIHNLTHLQSFRPVATIRTWGELTVGIPA